MRISSAEFIKNYGSVSDKALTEAVTITRNGRERLVLLSADEYARLKRRDRYVMLAEDLPENDLAMIAETEMSAAYAHLDEELKDWKP
ncbi:type II toxin-antitoxin system Phd/YefM family antitoxin [Pararhizobium sp. O133]|uniref:type II toxin-antitoxin system Phd/YefM family antitoxin n=1 Tax=Pararhizobium sp. O133 TaxID=3449278 RepID=UPI003F682F61